MEQLLALRLSQHRTRIETEKTDKFHEPFAICRRDDPTRVVVPGGRFLRAPCRARGHRSRPIEKDLRKRNSGQFF